MDFINENEHFFRTPNTNLKSKRAAFSSAKNTAKKVLTDVMNTIDKRRTEFDAAFASKSNLGVEEIREIYKSPKRVVSATNELKNEVAGADDFIFTSCRCSSEECVYDDFWKLPEELSLTKDDINICATRWCNVEFCPEDIIASSPVKFDSNAFDDCTPMKIRNSESFQELLNESFEVIPPELLF